jgi:hypothetical protein
MSKQMVSIGKLSNLLQAMAFCGVDVSAETQSAAVCRAKAHGFQGFLFTY